MFLTFHLPSPHTHMSSLCKWNECRMFAVFEAVSLGGHLLFNDNKSGGDVGDDEKSGNQQE
ncbi:hypothetical protein PP707_06760 [Acetobacter pasteurianus]|nr:hypothetical protein [Acetobacter pasteurianus]